MTNTDPTFEGMQRNVRDAVRIHSGVFLAQGIIMTLLGIAAIIWPQVSTIAVDVSVGWLLLLSGVLGLVLMFYAPNAASFFWSLMTGALTLFAGMLLLWHPIAGVVSLTLVLAAFFVAEGVFQIAAGVSNRSAFPESWLWMVLSGVTDLVLAFLIISGLPGSAAWALGLIVGVNLITSGVAIIIVASTVKAALKELERTVR